MSLPVAEQIEEVRRRVALARKEGKSVGLVPTMGALHEGHASLIRRARAETGFVVVSIFVNPTQFGPAEDFVRYPRTLAEDLTLCEQEKADLVFAPATETMYPDGFHTRIEVAGLQDRLCGASRPGHFRGVATVVAKLFHIVQPDAAYFGQKDAQQVRIIDQMVRDLNMPVRIRVCPIVREPDGLAISSRNRYLGAPERQNAAILFRALEEARHMVEAGERDAKRVRQKLMSLIESTPGATLDYAEVVRAENLETLERLAGEVLIAVAVRFGATRLIDNVVIQIAASSA
jgi:pantoate--beta-alanine ligase